MWPRTNTSRCPDRGMAGGAERPARPHRAALPAAGGPRAGREVSGRLAGAAGAAQRLAAGRGAGGAQPGWGAAVAAHRPLGCRGRARRPARLRGGAPGRSAGRAGHRRDRAFSRKGPSRSGWRGSTSGTAGRIENCQIGVFLGYASPRGHAFLDRALYLPKAWAEDAARREEAGIPPEVALRHQRASWRRAMLARAFAAEVPAAWVTGDEVYGNDGDLRRWLEGEQRPYVLGGGALASGLASWACRCGSMPWWSRSLPRRWQRLDVGAGSKGPRDL